MFVETTNLGNPYFYNKRIQCLCVKYTSKWDNGSQEFKSNAILNLTSGGIYCLEFFSGKNVEHLDESFINIGEKEYPLNNKDLLFKDDLIYINKKIDSFIRKFQRKTGKKELII